jgi:hypothetical protein
MIIADFGSEPPRYRITGVVPPKGEGDEWAPGYSFVSYDVGFTEEQAMEALNHLMAVMPEGTDLQLQSTRDRWERVEHGHRHVKTPIKPRPIKDTPQA